MEIDMKMKKNTGTHTQSLSNDINEQKCIINIDEPIPPEELEQIKSSVDDTEITGFVSLPDEYKPYFLQVKDATRRLGITLESVESPIYYTDFDSLALLFKKHNRDLTEEEANRIFLIINNRLKTRGLPLFRWKRRAYMRWVGGPEFGEVLIYCRGKAYYIYSVSTMVYPSR